MSLEEAIGARCDIPRRRKPVKAACRPDSEVNKLSLDIAHDRVNIGNANAEAAQPDCL